MLRCGCDEDGRIVVSQPILSDAAVDKSIFADKSQGASKDSLQNSMRVSRRSDYLELNRQEAYAPADATVATVKYIHAAGLIPV